MYSITFRITDASNEIKDKVKYLENLRKYFEQLHHEKKLTNVLNTILPSIMSNIRQMDSVSKFFAKSGFLGILFCKVRTLSIPIQF